MPVGNHFQVYVVGGFSAIGGFLFGYHMGVISGVLTMPDFKNRANVADINSNNLTADFMNTALIIGIFLLGCFFGSLFGGQTSDRFSRKYSISFFSFLFAASAAIQTFIDSSSSYREFLIQFLFGRFFGG